MRVLVVSNLFPPHHVGGYELRCAQVARALTERGDEVRVLTSDVSLAERPAADADAFPFPVDRDLAHYRRTPQTGVPYTLKLARRQLEDVRRTAAVLEEFEPDVVAWWNMEGLTKAVLDLPRRHSIPDACFVEDCWMIDEFGESGETDAFHWFDFWRGQWGPAPLRPLIRRWVARRASELEDAVPVHPFRLDPRRVCFVSEFLRWEHRAAGLRPDSTQVIYGGVPVGRFLHRRDPTEFGEDPLGLLFVGYLSRNRGLHTVIEALGQLRPEDRRRVRLSIAYGGPVHETSYSRELKRRVAELGLSESVSFMPRVAHEAMPPLYRDHQLLLVPTTRGEGLPLTMMEAAASGAAVATTGSGGAIELADRAGMPLFPKEHPVALSRLLRRILDDRRSLAEIASRGQEVVLEHFTLDGMVDEIRDALGSLAVDRGRTPEAGSG